MDKDFAEIVNWFIADTVQLLDFVLDDSDVDPQYSAVTCMRRFSLYIHYITGKPADLKDVLVYLKDSGYCDDDIDMFINKYIKEQKRYENN